MSDPKNIPGKLLALLFLKSAPQDLSYSPVLTVQLLAAYLFSGVLVMQTTLNPDDLFAGILLGLIVQLVFAYTVLSALDKRPRFLQTFCAMIGAGMLFNLISWPIFYVLADPAATESMKANMSLLFLFLISWEVLVKAHIFKHALEMKMYGAMALSFSMFFITVALSQLLFPAQGAG